MNRAPSLQRASSACSPATAFRFDGHGLARVHPAARRIGPR
ncbi:MAG TPA: hypothetical protein PLO41_16500 [Rubrivivax sp.]|nr:hypothetical protein [Rubrivivax sp.]